MFRVDPNDPDDIMAELERLLAGLPQEKKDSTPVVIRVEDKDIFIRLATEDDLLPFRQEILKKLNLSADEWDEVATKLDLPPDQWKAGRIQVQIISNDERQVYHYKDRVNSIYDAAEFLINSLEHFDEAYKKKLLKFLRGVADDCNGKLEAISNDPDLEVRIEISHYQNSLADYTKYVLDVLRTQLNMPKQRKGLKKNDILCEMLARSEEFALAKKTKPAIVTVSSLFKNADADLANHHEFMAMIDKPENPFSDYTDKKEFHDELERDLIDFGVALEVVDGKRIETNPDYQLPEWYEDLSKEQKHQIITLYDQIDEENAALEKTEEENPALEKVEKKRFDHPENLEKLRKKVVSIAFESAFKEELRAIQQNKSKQYPEWFMSLKKYEKDLLKAFLKDVDLDTDLGTTINAISSKLRLIPVPSNYSTHTLITHIKKMNEAAPTTIVHLSEKRSSHAASRDIRTRGKAVRDEHAQRNLYKMLDDVFREKMDELNNNQKLQAWATKKLEEDEITQPIVIHIPILYQTLITAFKEPDSSLDEDKKAAVAYMRKMIAEKQWFIEGTNDQIQVKFDLISTNHPLNVGKYLDPTSSAGPTGAEIARLLSVVTGGEKIYGVHGIAHKNFRRRDELRESIKNHNPLLQDDSLETKQKLELLTDACISLARITDDKRISVSMGPYRELYLSSLEQIVTSLAGGSSIGSCVSGKDRKAIEIAHTDAMEIFFTRFGRLPPPNPPISLLEELAEKLHVNAEKKNFPTIQDKRDSDAFAKIFAEIYCSKHQQFLAGQNANGSFGTKSPGMYLPAHLKKAVKQWYADRDKLEGPYKGLASRNITKEDSIRAGNNDIKKISAIFPRLKERIAKIFRKKLVVHVPSEELQWKSSVMENREIYSLSEEEFRSVNVRAVSGLAVYAAEQGVEAKKTGFFSHSSDAKKELMRIQMFQSLLNDKSNLSPFQKNVLLYTIMQGENDAKLQQVILQALQIPTLESARYILVSNMRRVMNEYLDRQIAKGEIVEEKRTKEFAQIEIEVTSIVRDVLKFIDQKIESNFDYKEKKKDTEEDKLYQRNQMVLKSTNMVASILSSVSEKDPHRIRTLEQAEEHRERMENLKYI